MSYSPFRGQALVSPFMAGEFQMITEIVTFKLPDGMTHEDVVANFEKTAPNWKANPDLIRKNYLVDAKKWPGRRCVLVERAGQCGKVARRGVPK